MRLRALLFVLLLCAPLAAAQSFDFEVKHRWGGSPSLTTRANLPLGPTAWFLPEASGSLQGLDYLRGHFLVELEHFTVAVDLRADWEAGRVGGLEGRAALYFAISSFNLEAGYRHSWSGELKSTGGGIYTLARADLELGKMWGVSLRLLPEVGFEGGAGGERYFRVQLLADMEHMTLFAAVRVPWRGEMRETVFEIGARFGVTLGEREEATAGEARDRIMAGLLTSCRSLEAIAPAHAISESLRASCARVGVTL